ncbi:hypothetical protein WJX77_003938 [Trebouxia sp. C0004]
MLEVLQGVFTTMGLERVTRQGFKAMLGLPMSAGAKPSLHVLPAIVLSAAVLLAVMCPFRFTLRVAFVSLSLATSWHVAAGQYFLLHSLPVHKVIAAASAQQVPACSSGFFVTEHCSPDDHFWLVSGDSKQCAEWNSVCCLLIDNVRRACLPDCCQGAAQLPSQPRCTSDLHTKPSLEPHLMKVTCQQAHI